VLVTVWHVPAPLQVRAGVYVDPVHDSITQVVPEDHLRQAPAPSHSPSSPQVDADSWVQSPLGSVPFETGRQRPSGWPVLALEQAEQRPAHAVSQQTLSTQFPLAHSPPPPQLAPPVLSGTHAVPAQ
jgi:hypothetical protein